MEEDRVFIHTGLASSRKMIAIEKHAYNEKNSKAPDNGGQIYLGYKIAPSSPDIITTPLDAEAIVDVLNKSGIRAASSIPGVMSAATSTIIPFSKEGNLFSSTFRPSQTKASEKTSERWR